MEIKMVNHRTIKEIPKEVKDFFDRILSNHISEIGENQFIDRMNIGISIHRNEAIIETSSSDFQYNPNKGLEQFI